MPHAGFDASGYPGDLVMLELKRTTNFEWCGFYLGPAPSHPDPGWMPHLAVLKGQGWGFAPIYVGQQTEGPGSHVVTAAQGSIDGAHAAGLMRSAGFGVGSFVYLDLENGAPFIAFQRGYVGAWCDAVVAAGFGAGVYCSFQFAAEVSKLRPDARIWVFHVRTVSAHPVVGATFPAPDPATSGFPGASIWQHDDSAEITVSGKTLLVDLDSAAMDDPSAPLAKPVPIAASPVDRINTIQTTLTTQIAVAMNNPTTKKEGWLAKLEAHVQEFFNLD